MARVERHPSNVVTVDAVIQPGLLSPASVDPARRIIRKAGQDGHVVSARHKPLRDIRRYGCLLGRKPLGQDHSPHDTLPSIVRSVQVRAELCYKRGATAGKVCIRRLDPAI
jgi:hypothetical protein